MIPFWQSDGISIYNADALDWAENYDGTPFHAVFCDPPYGLGAEPDMTEVLTHWLAGDDYKARGGGFMGKRWDACVPGPATWRAIREHVHPGGYGLAFGGTRTADLLSVSMRLAGWERFDSIAWVYGSGFCKNHNISKAIDKAAGAEREVIGRGSHCGLHHRGGADCFTDDNRKAENRIGDYSIITRPATPAAQAFDGYGTALKPSIENILCFRNSRDGRTYADIAQETGAGGLNIDGGRVGKPFNGTRPKYRLTSKGAKGGAWSNQDAPKMKRLNGETSGHPQGRWPANLIHDGSPAVLAEFPVTNGNAGARTNKGKDNTCYGEYETITTKSQARGDSGTAARYFYTADWSLDIFEQLNSVAPFYYCSKANRRGELNECNAGAGENKHPTVKPLTLVKYICVILLPPKEYAPRRLLVPFAGSGSEAIGALLAGWDEIVLVEMQERHCEVARDRLIWWRDAMTRYGTEPKDVIKAARKNGKTKRKQLELV